ncbi:MAG: roadblock/LC7 domain-containing protein [Pseudomonadota bacterium]|nr:roadblock/LC7 domain-containing protein [Pseudomonadota bacterium]
MDISQIESILKDLNEDNPGILLSMIVTPDGLTLAYEGRVEEPDEVAALYIELQLVCKKIMSELKYGKVEEMFIRASSGCVSILPIFDKGILACMSTPEVNSGMMQMITWQAVNRLARLL